MVAAEEGEEIMLEAMLEDIIIVTCFDVRGRVLDFRCTSYFEVVLAIPLHTVEGL